MAGISAHTLREWFRADIEAPLEGLVGGRRRLGLIVLLDLVLALDSADQAMVGAIATQLEASLHIDNVEVGWLVTASTGIGALLTLPFSVFADRTRRTRLLVIAIVTWSLAMAAGGLLPSYLTLLASRLLLGASIAAAGPAVVSLTGDYFRPGERGRIFGYILAGELIGVAFGYVILGNVAALWSWRASFLVLAVLGLALAVVIARNLPEPRRGGQGLAPVRAAGKDEQRATAAGAGKRQDMLEEGVEERGVEPYDDLVLREDPTGWSLWRAVRYILSVRTYRALIVASSLGYFYFTGMRTFAIVFLRGRFGLDEATATMLAVGLGLGSIAGVLLAGRAGDALIGRGRLDGRILVGAAAYLAATVALVPALLIGSLAFAAPFFVLAAAGLGGANPAVDSARLDVMHSSLWGRAEGVRATLRLALEAVAPPAFGYLGAWLGGRGTEPLARDLSDATGLDRALLVLLVALALAGLILLVRATRTYPRDVATTIASEHHTMSAS